VLKFNIRRRKFMLIDTNKIVSMTEANQNFSNVVRLAEENGSVVIFKNNAPKYILLDIDACRLELPKSDERIEKAAKRKISRAKWL
jgi:antitoxin Phd